MDPSDLLQLGAAGAGILALVYTVLVGQRTAKELWSGRREAKRLRQAPSPAALESPSKVTVVTWEEITGAITKFRDESTIAYDVIVGIAKVGLPIAVSIASAFPQSRFSALLKRYIGTKQVPFFVFEQETHQWSIRKRAFDDFTLPSLGREVKRVLIVDAVTTFGNTLAAAEELVRAQVADCEVDFYVYAVDVARLAASMPSVSQRTYYHRAIDNRTEWLRFPWELEGSD